MSWNIKTPGDYINGPLTVAGAATITGDLTVATNRLIVNSVGVSTGGSPAGNFGFTTVGKTGGIFANKNAAAQYLAFQMKNSTADYSLYIDQDGNGSNSWSLFDTTNGQTALRYYPGASGFWNLHINGGVALALNANGALVLKNGSASANGVGVAFPATQVASSDANCLDDYEEGTWVGTYVFLTTPQTSSNSFTGRYTKVGRIVTVQGTMLIGPGGFVKGLGAGQLQLTGLPFAVQNAATLYQDLAASLADINTGSLCFCGIGAGATSFGFESMGVVGAVVQRNSAAITAANFAATNANYISISLNFNYTS